MMLANGLLMLMQTTGTCQAEVRPRQRIVISATRQSETPLPLAFTDAVRALTMTSAVTPSVLNRVGIVRNRVEMLASELRIDPSAQALVDRLVEAAAPPRGQKKRILPRRPA